MPLVLTISFGEYKSTFFTKAVWFSLRPCCELARQWSIVHPVKFIVLYSVQSNPRTTISHVRMAHYQAKDKVVLISRFDDRQMCIVILTKRESIAPICCWGVVNEVAGTPMTMPTLRTLLLVSRSGQKNETTLSPNIIIMTMSKEGWNVTAKKQLQQTIFECYASFNNK